MIFRNSLEIEQFRDLINYPLGRTDPKIGAVPVETVRMICLGMIEFPQCISGWKTVYITK